MGKYFSNVPVWMDFPFEHLQGIAGGELQLYFHDEPDAVRWVQLIVGNPHVAEEQHKHAGRVTVALVQENAANANQEGIHERYLTKEAVDLIERKPEGTQPPFS